MIYIISVLFVGQRTDDYLLVKRIEQEKQYVCLSKDRNKFQHSSIAMLVKEVFWAVDSISTTYK